MYKRAVYYTMGAYAAMLVSQGGPGFPIFAETTFAYFSTGKTTNSAIPVEDFPLSTWLSR